MGEEWQIRPGTVLRRREVHALFGGQQQGGISTPSGRDFILIFTDPDRGARFGYDRFEGVREDGVYCYTGAGQEGDQQLSGGNEAILASSEQGKTIHLFSARSPWATYLGEYVLAEDPYEWVRIPDKNRADRQAVLFHFLPVSSTSEATMSPPAGRASTSYSAWNAPAGSPYVVPGMTTETGSASPREFELQADFGAWLLGLGHDVQQMTIAVGATTLRPDLFDATSGLIFEAKMSPARGHVRTAIGQVLDYVNNARCEHPGAAPAILLPGAPAEDLMGLCRSLEIHIFVRNGQGFTELS